MDQWVATMKDENSLKKSTYALIGSSLYTSNINYTRFWNSDVISSTNGSATAVCLEKKGDEEICTLFTFVL
jgi:hypothetical protein